MAEIELMITFEMAMDEEDVKQIRAFFRAANDLPDSEMELRFKGISKEMFDAVLIQCQKVFPKNQQHGKSTIDSFYEHPEKKDVFIRVSEQSVAEKIIQEKISVCKPYYFKTHNIKMCLATETKIDPDISSLKLRFVRKKERFTFRTELINYDLTVVREGDSVKDLETAILKFEIELEYFGNHNSKYVPREEFYMREMTAAISFITSTIAAIPFGQNTNRATKTEQKRIPIFFRTALESAQSSKFQEPRPITLHRKHIADLKTGKYSVTSKPDGVRRYLIFDNIGRDHDGKKQYCGYLYDHACRRTELSGIFSSKISNTIIDGEFLPKKNLFLAFDILVFQETDVRRSELKTRRMILERCAKELDNQAFQIKPLYHPEESDIFKKSFEIMKEFQKDNRPWDNDGLVYVPIDTYNSSLPMFKWKPGDCNTIDFLVLRNENQENTWDLYNMVNMKDRSMIYNGRAIQKFPHNGTVVWDCKKKMADGNLMFNGCVAEFYWDRNANTFVPTRLRKDKIDAKKHGNFMLVALDNWESIQNPVTIEEIQKADSDQSLQSLTTTDIVQTLRSVVPEIPETAEVMSATKQASTAKRSRDDNNGTVGSESPAKRKRYTLDQLKVMAKNKGVKGYYKLNREKAYEAVFGEPEQR